MQDTENTFPVASDTKELEHGERFAPRFDAHGLIPAIVTDEKSGEVLMFAWKVRREAGGDRFGTSG